MPTRRSGSSLVIAAIGGGAFFWLTDARYGFGQPGGANPIDAAHDMLVGTAVGLAGCVVVGGIGLWLLTRRVG